MEKKRITEPVAFITECLHGATDPHFHAVTRYQVSTTVYPTKTVLIVEMSYHEDATQLSYVNNKVRELIAKIIHPSMHNQQKLLAIHDWITANVLYDHTLQRRSAYDALYHASTVCSGYASLFWHMCDAVGIPCRIVTGIGKFEAHAWNMVQLDNHWYHIDTTWCTVADQEAPFSVYRFYLLTDKEIRRTHTVTILHNQKPFPPAQMQYREHLLQLGRSQPRLHTIIQHIQQKTGLAYLEPEYTVIGITQLNKRLITACHKRHHRLLFGYRGASISAQKDIQEALYDIKAQLAHGVAIKVMMYPMPHGFTDDTVLVDVYLTYM